MPAPRSSTGAGSGPAPVWRRADDDLWVATVAGEYGGLIARVPDGFRAHDRYTRPIGVAATLAEAMRLHTSPRPGTACARRARRTHRPRPSGATTGPTFAGPSHQREKTS